MNQNHPIKLKTLAIFLVLCLFLTGFRIYLNHSLQRHEIEDMVTLHISNIENDLSYAADELYAVQSLIVGANGGPVDLEKVSQVLRQDAMDRFIRCVLLAPEGIVDQVYPLEGNEYNLGLDLYAPEYANAGAVLESLRTGDLVISAPHTAKTGDRFLIARLPVNLPQKDGAWENWGMVSICIGFPDILENLRTDVLKEAGYAYRIVALDSQGAAADTLLEHQFRNVRSTILRDFTLAGMALRIETAPQQGWLNAGQALWLFLQMFAAGLVLSLAGKYLVRRIRQVVTDATMDEMTGVLNRTSGEREINRIIQSKTFEKGIFMMLDMDNFKLLNDTFGHQQGDEALKRCAATLKSMFRKNDAICRLGGDEFVVFLPYSGDGSFARKKIAQLLEALQWDMVEQEKAVHVSVSIGVSLAPAHGATFDELYMHADMALYRSKALGRNCCTLYQPSGMTEADSSSPTAFTRPKTYSDCRTILIVDDDSMNRELIKFIFSDRFAFVEAENGREGLDRAKEYANDLCAILVDASMPVMDGIEMLRILHQQGIPARIPVFMITAHTEGDISEEAYRYGVRDVIAKPIMPVIIQRRVQTVIELFQARDMLKHIVKIAAEEKDYA